MNGNKLLGQALSIMASKPVEESVAYTSELPPCLFTRVLVGELDGDCARETEREFRLLLTCADLAIEGVSRGWPVVDVGNGCE